MIEYPSYGADSGLEPDREGVLLAHCAAQSEEIEELEEKLEETKSALLFASIPFILLTLVDVALGEYAFALFWTGAAAFCWWVVRRVNR